MIPVFIGGTGRSGTTVLRQILAQHSCIAAMPYELRLIVDPGGVLDLISALSERWSPYSADIAIHQFRRLLLSCASRTRCSRVLARVLSSMGVTPRPYTKMGLGELIGQEYYRNRLDTLLRTITHHVTHGRWMGSPAFQVQPKIYEAGPFQRQEIAPLLAEFIHDLYRALPGKSNKTYWVEDSPYNIVYAYELWTVFPHMRFIHIYRDPLDVLASYRTTAWGGEHVEAIARRLAGILQRWFAIRECLPQESFTEIALEELAEKSRSHLTRICHFIGVEYEHALEEIPLNKVNAGRWRQDLTKAELRLIFPILEPTRVMLTSKISSHARDSR